MIRASVLEKFLLLLSDFIGLGLCYYGAFWLQFHSGWIVDKHDPSRSFEQYAQAGFVLNLVWMGLFAFFGMYRKWLLESRLFQGMQMAKAIFVGLGMVALALFGTTLIASVFAPRISTGEMLYASRAKLIVVYGVGILLILMSLRLFVTSFLRQMLRKGIGADRILVLGANELGAEITAQLSRAPQLGQKVIGFVDERHASMSTKDFNGYPILGKYSDLVRIVRKEKVSGIVIAHESSSIREMLRVFDWLAEEPIHIYVIPDLYDVVAGHFKGNLVHGIDLQEVFVFNMAPWQVQLKRLLDIIVAGGLLLATLPMTLFTAMLIRLDSKGPIFYSQERVGLYGRPFVVHKFRTMRTDAEKAGPQWATKNDPRITRIGRFLRKTRIDEIPQLLCVLKGDMSMVGPRPEREHFVEQLRQQIPFYMLRLRMKPGLTGWAQVRHSYDTSIEDVQKKLKYDLYYFENMSILLDLQILFRTVWVVLTGKGAQ